MRRHQRKSIDEFFQCYRHQHLRSSDRWIIPLLDYMEENLWSESEAGGDLWNGRWTPHLLSSLLGEASHAPAERRDFQRALAWLTQLTSLLQNAQRILYGVRHVELLSLDSKTRRATVISLRRKRKISAARTLFAAWRIPYAKPLVPRRKAISLTSPPLTTNPAPKTQALLLRSDRWVQFSKAKSVANPMVLTSVRRMHKCSRREEHRTSKLRLRKLRNILILCR
jgi:hypothetical protein